MTLQEIAKSQLVVLTITRPDIKSLICHQNGGTVVLTGEEYGIIAEEFPILPRGVKAHYLSHSDRRKCPKAEALRNRYFHQGPLYCVPMRADAVRAARWALNNPSRS